MATNGYNTLKYIVRSTLGVIFVIYISTITLLNTSYVQNRLSAWVSDELEEVLHTEVHIGRIDLGILNRIILEDVLLHDQNKDELLKVARLSAKFEISPLFKGKISISSVQLFGFNIQLKRENPEVAPNYQFVLDALASKDTVKKDKTLDLRINTILVRRGKISYDLASAPETLGKFNINHLGIKDLAATLSIKSMNKDSLNATIKRMDLSEQSGFCLKKITMALKANHQGILLKDFSVELPNSNVKMDSLSISLKPLKQPNESPTIKHIDGKFSGSITPLDLAAFVPGLKNMETPIFLKGGIEGDSKNINLSSIQAWDKQGLSLTIQGKAIDWNKPGKMYVNAKIKEFSIRQNRLKEILSGVGKTYPHMLEKLEYIKLQGNLEGHPNLLQATGSIMSNAGILETKLNMHKLEDGSHSLSGKLTSKQLHIGTLVNNQKHFGNAQFDIELKEFKYKKGKYPETYIKGEIASFEYNEHTYENLMMDGIYKNGGFNGILAINDEYGSLSVNGNFNVTTPLPVFNVGISLRDFQPNKLNLTKKHENARISLDILANFQGNNIDDLEGELSIKDIKLVTPDKEGDFYMKELKISASQNKQAKILTLTSPFIQAKIEGDYKYNSLPTSAVQLLHKYIPSLLPLKPYQRKTDNDFKFSILASENDFFTKFVGLPLQFDMPIKINGHLSDRDSTILIQGNFPQLTYNGSKYDSGILNISNGPKDCICILRGGKLMKSGAMLNFALNGRMVNDSIHTIINWGNNTDITYGGKLAATACFSRDNNSLKDLTTNILIHPTNVILNDTTWQVRPSRISINKDEVIINHFSFKQNEKRQLHIDGKLNKNAQDSCIVRLKDIDVSYVLDIVRFDDVAFDGLVTGDVVLKNIFDKPQMYTHINVHNFGVNHACLGNANIRGKWDNETGSIRLKADIAEPDFSRTVVTGFVSPKMNGLDLTIEADNTNLALLDPYIEGVFSNFMGRGNGYVHLYGPFSKLDLEGKMKISADAKIDVLNTNFFLNNDSVLLSSGKIDFKDIHIKDTEGHSGIVNGYLHHQKLKHMMYNFHIKGNKLLMYDTKTTENMPFYGKVYGTGDVTINGGNNAMNIGARITVNNHSNFTYVNGITTEATSNQFVTFVDKTPKRRQEEVETYLYHFKNAKKEEEEEGPPMDLRMNMLINVTPEATMKVIMDPRAGDDITATGNGDIQVDFYNKGDFKMFGNYVIDRGKYRLSMQEVIRKDFSLLQGGTISFNGDPYRANLDLQAVYTVNSASLSDLGIATKAQGQNTVKVNCLMNLNGSLTSPNIKFDLELPTVKEEDRELVRSITSTEEQLNTQIIYLLGIGRFYTFDYANNDQTSNATSSLAFSTLSGQLNNMLSQWTENKNWNIGANFTTGEKGWSNVEAQALLSGRLLNNRLIINGNFGYKENVLANTNFVGDFEAIWILTKNGEWRLRGYNQTNDRYFTKPTLTTQGVGIMYKKDFERWRDLFRWLFSKKSNKEKTAE